MAAISHNEAKLIRYATHDLSVAKSRAAYVLEHWDTLPDVDASVGQLEQAVELLGRVIDDLEAAC